MAAIYVIMHNRGCIMANVTVQSRVRLELKEQSEAVFKAMGLSISDAIRVFLQQSVNVGGLPFQPLVKRPNEETIIAMYEAHEGKGESFNNKEELFDSWDKI